MDSPSTNQTGAAGAVRDKPGCCQNEAIRASVSTAGRYLSTGQGRGFSLFDGLATRTTRAPVRCIPNIESEGERKCVAVRSLTSSGCQWRLGSETKERKRARKSKRKKDQQEPTARWVGSRKVSHALVPCIWCLEPFPFCPSVRYGVLYRVHYHYYCTPYAVRIGR